MGSIKIRQSKEGKKIFDVDIRRKGCPRVFQTFDSLTRAKLWLHDTESAMRSGRFINQCEAKKHTLGEAIDRYIEDELPKKPLSYEEQKYQLDWLKNEVGYKLLADLTPPVLVEVKSNFLKGTNAHGIGRSPQTWNRYQSILSCVFQKCCNEWLWMDSNPARRLKREKETRGRVRSLQDDEREKLLEACKNSESRNLHCAVVLALSTGMRNAEIRYLTWDKVDLQVGTIILDTTKNGERRRVPVKGYALELLKEHGKVRRLDSNLVFPGKKKQGKVVPFDLNMWWNKAVAEAGITDFRFHDLRHACASYLAMDGASLLEIAEVLGHKTLQMVKRYSHLAESHTASVVERMNRKIFGK